MTGRGLVAVAASGGRDSTALLHVTARMAVQLGLRVAALHVHHGLMPEADAWQRQVRAQCTRWAKKGLPVCFESRRLTGRPAAGESVEAWARKERYRALAEMAKSLGADAVLLAHHRQDQAETFLLQALRGGSPKGLAGMPAAAHRAGLWWYRPWLNLSPSAIQAYVDRHRLSYVVDGSNADPRFARSRLRSQIWPVLQASFPEAEVSLSAAAGRAQESLACLLEMAQADAAGCSSAEGDLLLEPWAALSLPRRTHLLRHWLQTSSAGSVPETLVRRLVVEWPAAGTGHKWPLRDGFVHSARGRLAWHAQVTLATPAAPFMTNGAADEKDMDLSVPGSYPVPQWGGRFVVSQASGAGISSTQLACAQLKPRTGGERFQAQARSPARSLKKQYQDAGVALALREGPLVFVGDQLVYVPRLGMDARACTFRGPDALTLHWVADGGR